MKHFLVLLTALSFALFANLACALPQVTRPVNDYVGVLTAEDTAQLAATFNAHRASNPSTTVALLVVRTTEGLPLEDFTHAVASEWGGGGVTSRGALIVFVMDTHQSRIEVGRGLEGELTDVEARRILDNVRPLLRSGAMSTAMRRVGEDVVAETGGRVTPRAPAAIHRAPATEDDDTAFYLIAFVVVLGLGIGLLVWYVSRQRERRYTYGGYSSGYSPSSSDTFVYVDNSSSYYGGGSSSTSSGRSSGGYSSSLFSNDSSSSSNSWSDSSSSGGSYDGGGGSSDW